MRPAPPLRKRQAAWHKPYAKEPSIVEEGRFRFLNEERTLHFPEDWNASEQSKLWLYNLHYFDDLNARDAEGKVNLHESLIHRWIEDNPPTFGVGWEAYPLSIRIANWIKWALAGNRLSDRAQYSLAVQIRQLSRNLEYHLLGNHLLENAKALIFGGLFYSGGEAEEWFTTGRQILDVQLPEQILDDGGHFELSSMYHSLVLEGMLDLLNIHQVYGISTPPTWISIVLRMLNWLRTMSHPDGNISFFNDATLGIAPRLSELENYADALCIPKNPEAHGSALLRHSGYARLEHAGATLIADVAAIGPNYIPGHAHADTLSFELALRNRRILVNSGISTYGVGPERLRQRGTASHNTVRLDGVDSSEVWSGFRVAKRARVRVEAFGIEPTPFLASSHDGYCHLPGKPVHRRSWKMQDGAVALTDDICGQGHHLVEVFFHFHPSLQVAPTGDSKFLIRNQDNSLLMTIHTAPALKWEIGVGRWHPEFGISLPNSYLRGEYKDALPLSFDTLFAW